jgi:hypothetical protein
MRAGSPMQVVPSRTGTNAYGIRHYLRLFAWGAGATLALAVAVAAGRTEPGTERVQSALAAMLGTKPVAKDSSSDVVARSSAVDAQMRRQADVIRDLAEQRDGLADKVGAMERRVTELGGTLSRALARIDADAKSAREAATSASTAAAQAAANARLTEARQQATESAAAPLAPATPRDIATATPPNAAPTPQAVRPSREASTPLNLLPYSQILPGITAGGSGFASAAAAPTYTGAIPMLSPEPVAPPVAARPFAGEAQVMAPPAHAPPPIPVPLPPPAAPPRAASTEPTGSGPLAHGATKPHPAAVQLPQLQSNPLMTAGIFNGPVEPGVIAAEFAIDLGGAPTIEVLRTRWNELRTSQSPLLDSLKPLVALKEGGQTGQELHLIAGPLASTAATARLCAVLSGGGVTCQPSTFEGQRLTR